MAAVSAGTARTESIASVRRTEAVEVVDLVKRYPKRDVNAVDGISFVVHPGEVFGLLGPNGAGKSTTIGVLTTRVLATSGRAYVSGVDVMAHPVLARSKLAVVPQRVNIDRAITARQNLTFHAAYHGIGKAEREQRADRLLTQLGLTAQANDKVDAYSGGQAQRLMIARALMHEPDVLFLDEPSTGLDPQARLFVWDRIRELQRSGVTMVLTTHDMDEADLLCDRIGIVDHGRLLRLDTPDALIRSLPGSTHIDVMLEDPASASANGLHGQLSSLAGVHRVEPGPDGNGLRLFLDDEPARLLAPVIEIVRGHGAQLRDISFGRASLEDVFISLTGRGLR
jgi:ABC-2 type transport system ATP-binding protein